MHSSEATFSIVIPTYRRAERLGVALQALAELNYPRSKFEVIVVDDGSELPPKQVIDEYSEKLALNLLVQKHSGPATARNLGSANAKYRFLAFTDDDCSPAPDWLQKLAQRFTANPVSGIGGRIINSLTENPFSNASQLLVDYLYSYFNADPEKPRLFTGNNMAYPTDEFLAAGSFETSFDTAGGEDREMCDRWVQSGYGLLYAPEVIVYHRHFLSPRSFLRQHYNYGRGAFHYRKVQAIKSHKGVPLEPLSFYWNLVRYPLANSHSKQPWLLAALMGLSQAATATGYFREKLFSQEEKRGTSAGEDPSNQ